MLNTNPRVILQGLVLLCFLALIVFLPSVQFMPEYIIWFNDRQRLLELLLLSFVLLDCLFNGLVIKSCVLAIAQPLRRAFFTLLALACISAYLAESPRHAVIEISVFAALCYLSLFVAKLYNANKQKFIKQISYAYGQVYCCICCLFILVILPPLFLKHL